MQVAELAFGVGIATGGFEPALEDGGGAGPLGPVAVGAIGGFDQRAQGAITEEAFDRGGIFRADGRDQVEDYAARKGWTIEQTERWLRPVLGYKT